MIIRLLKKQWLLLLSLALNAVLVLVCMSTLKTAQKYYTEYRYFRPLAHGTSESTDLPADHGDSTVVVMYGDSRISQWDPLPSLPNTTFIDAGIAGETTTEMRRRIEHDVLRHKPDIILVQSGMNDLTASITKGIPDPQGMLVEMKTNLEYLTQVFKESGATVVLTPVLPGKPLNFQRKMFWHNELDQRVGETNDFLNGLATQQGVEWLDLSRALYNDNNELRVDWYIDALHVQKPAYEALNELVEQHLAQNR
jgi:lysophospholipase L1-like esterase